MPHIDLPATGEVHPNFGVTTVGSGSIWADGTDATYLYSPPGDSANPGWGQANLAAEVLPFRPYQAWARLKFTPQSTDPVPGTSLFQSGLGTIATINNTQPAVVDGDRVLVPLTVTDWSWLSQTGQVAILVGHSGFDSPQAWYIYEAGIRLQWKSTEAPPRRLYPRSDGLGVSGGRRHWPPPASQQRGIRRAGGYL